MNAIDLFPYWADTRAPLLESLEVLSDEDLEQRPATGFPSIGQLLRHVITTEEHWWRGGILGDPWEAWRPDGWATFGAEQKEAYRIGRFPTLAAIRDGLTASRAPVDAFLRGFEAEGLCEKRRATWGEDNTLRWIVWHLVEHEQHHRAQLFTRLRLLGRTPPSTFPRLAVMATTPAKRWTGGADALQVVPYWKPLLASLRDAVVALGPADLGYRPAEGLPSIGDLVLHVLAGQDLLLRRGVGPDLAGGASHLPARAWRIPVPELYQALGEPFPDGGAFAAAIDRVHAMTHTFLSGLRQADLVRTHRTPWGPQTLHHALWYAREHVVHHRAQLFFRMRMIGRTPPAM